MIIPVLGEFKRSPKTDELIKEKIVKGTGWGFPSESKNRFPVFFSFGIIFRYLLLI